MKKMMHLLIVCAVVVILFAGCSAAKPNGITDENSSTETNTTINKIGNTSGNINNGGMVAQQGDWLYYYELPGGDFYKIKTDGTEKTLLDNVDSITFINIKDDWIYYCSGSSKAYSTDAGNIYKIKTDGSERTLISDDVAASLNVANDWIYYAKFEGTVPAADDDKYQVLYFSLYKIKTDGTEKTKLSDDNSGGLNVAGDWIYYANGSDQGRIYRMKTDGAEKTKLTDDTSHLIYILDDWIYYFTGPPDFNLFKMKTDGTAKTEIQ